MMNKALRLLLPVVVAPLLLALGCGVPLPAPELTATAQSQLPEPEPETARSGSAVDSASSGAPSSSALSLQQTANQDDPPSALAPLEHEELAGETPTADDVAAVETPEAEGEAAATATPTSESASEPTPEADATDEATPEGDEDADTSGYAGQMLDLLNQYRVENGIPALEFDATLTASATAYAEYMATAGFFGHYPPDGSTPAGRIAAAGFEGQYEGEALSAGQPSPAVALSRLLGSSAHAQILLNPNAVAAGVGHYYDPNSYYGHYWVIVTANP